MFSISLLSLSLFFSLHVKKIIIFLSKYASGWERYMCGQQECHRKKNKHPKSLYSIKYLFSNEWHIQASTFELFPSHSTSCLRKSLQKWQQNITLSSWAWFNINTLWLLLPLVLSNVIALDSCTPFSTCQLIASAYKPDTFLWSVCHLP